MGIIIAFVILGVIIVGIVSGGVAIYNRLVMLKYNVDKNFANIDVILKQRVDEIPNLIAVVKKTQGYEESLLNQLTELRTAFLSSRSTDEKVQLANEVGKLLNSFFAVSERLPFSSIPSRMAGEPRLEVKIITVFLKFTVLPCPSVIRPSSSTCKSTLNTSGCAFSTSSNSTTQ